MADPLFDAMMKRAVAENPDALTQEPTSKPSSGTGDTLANLMYFAGLGGDIATTAMGTRKGLVETNPLTKFAGQKAAAPLVAGGGLLTYLLAKKLLKDKHPKILKGILMGMGGVHGAAALNNVKEMRKQGAAPVPSAPSTGNMVQAPDGSWYDPNFFPGLK